MNGDGKTADVLTPVELEVALQPELSRETFTIGGKQYQLKELPSFYERKIVGIVSEIIDKISEMQTSTIIDGMMGKLPEVVAVILYAQSMMEAVPSGPWNTDKWREIVQWLEMNSFTMEMAGIVQQQLVKNRFASRVGEFSAQGIVASLAGSLSTLSSPASSKRSPGPA